MYQYDIWYMSLNVGDRLVRRFGRSVQTCIPDGHLHTVTYPRYRIDTTESPDDEHLNARNLWRIEINIQKRIGHQVGHYISVALVRERTIPTERPPPFGEVSANFCG